MHSAFRSAPSIEIMTPGDKGLATEVRQKIEDHPSLKALKISVWSVDKAVCLDGQNDMQRHSGEAENVARSVPGVRKVYNHVPRTARSDALRMWPARAILRITLASSRSDGNSRSLIELFT